MNEKIDVEDKINPGKKDVNLIRANIAEVLIISTKKLKVKE